MRGCRWWSRGIRNYGDAPIEVLESLALLELRVKRECGDIQEGHDRGEPTDAIDGREEDERASRVAQEEIV